LVWFVCFKNMVLLTDSNYMHIFGYPWITHTLISTALIPLLATADSKMLPGYRIH